MSEQFYTRLTGTTFGPYSAERIQEKIIKGEINRETLLRTDDEDWFPAGTRHFAFYGEAEPTVRYVKIEPKLPANPPKKLSPYYSYLQQAFWWLFFLLPFFTGWLSYDWLPNESYDADQHELLEVSEKIDGDGGYIEIPMSWQHKETHEIFTRADFLEHRNSEHLRMAVVMFGYGLIGCFFYAWTQSLKKVGAFCEAFGLAVLVNLGITLLFSISRGFD